jgi:hypothetical protein
VSGRAFTAGSIGTALDDAINLPLYGAGVGVDVHVNPLGHGGLILVDAL